MKDFVGEFKIQTINDEISVEAYSIMKKKNSLEYEILPVYKIGDKEIIFERGSTFRRHKSAIDCIKYGRDIDFE